MGWYHVRRSGKGIFLGPVENVHFNMEALAKYLPDWNEEGVEVNDLPENILSTRNEWPLLWEFAALNPKQHWCWGNEDSKELHYLKTNILANAMHYCFEKKYGYPYHSFVSTGDYNDNIMFFCDVQWPPREYNQALAEMTEEKMELQMREFLSEVTSMDASRMMLGICKEYDKD